MFSRFRSRISLSPPQSNEIAAADDDSLALLLFDLGTPNSSVRNIKSPSIRVAGSNSGKEPPAAAVPAAAPATFFPAKAERKAEARNKSTDDVGSQGAWQFNRLFAGPGFGQSVKLRRSYRGGGIYGFQRFCT